ncbi:ribonucleoside triphosphate reductase [bacterium]|nr:ribonucleoside triphosphate reductase [bacterium]
MFQIVKRDGSEVRFDISRIKLAIEKAFLAKKMVFTTDIIDLLALRATALFQKRVENDKIDIEEVQDFVEVALEQAGYAEVAKAYILYRKQREKLRNMSSTLIDYKNIVNNYVKSEDWRVKENSTVTYSVGGLILHNSGAVTANYWLTEVYDEEIAEAHGSGDLHIHDLSMLTAYCAGWSLKQLIQEGLGGVQGKITSAPAAHLHTLANQMVNFLGIMQNEWAGAQAFSSFDTYLAPFVKVDKLSYKEVKQAIQAFVFGVNIPSRWGTQSPFSNITLDWVVPDDLANLPAIVGGKEQDFSYNTCQKEMDMINKAFLEIMIDGDAQGRGFQYPIPTYNITKEFRWETKNAQLLFEMTAKYGTPYFQNFINSDMEPGDVRSMCCRLQLDKRELRKKTGGLFGSGEQTGSVGVVTINLPRIAFNAKDEGEFFQRLEYLMNIAKRSLESKRVITTRLMDQGFYPYSKRYLGNFDSHFSTIGLVGMNEMCLNASFIKESIGEERGKAFSIRVLEFMRDRLMDYQEETGNFYNLEATPAESTAYRLAKMDVARFPAIITAAEGDNATPYYTNSCHLPVNYTDDIFEALSIQDEIQTKFTGGTVFHTFLGERIDSWEATATLVKKIAYSFHLPYFTISPTYSVCQNCGYLKGEQSHCPDCGEETEVYSRITGYYRPIKHWNDGKTQEFKQRQEYDAYGQYEVIETGALPQKVDNTKVSEESAVFAGLGTTSDRKILLFTTKQCPNCPTAKEELKDISAVEMMDAEEHQQLSIQYGIRSVPSLIVESNGSVDRYIGVNDIIGFKNKFFQNK